jgi:hypothetical protein
VEASVHDILRPMPVYPPIACADALPWFFFSATVQHQMLTYPLKSPQFFKCVTEKGLTEQIKSPFIREISFKFICSGFFGAVKKVNSLKANKLKFWPSTLLFYFAKHYPAQTSRYTRRV